MINQDFIVKLYLTIMQAEGRIVLSAIAQCGGIRSYNADCNKYEDELFLDLIRDVAERYQVKIV